MTLATLKARLARAKKAAATNSYTMQGNTVTLSADWRAHTRGRWQVKPAGAWQDPATMGRHASPSRRAYYCDTWPEGWRHVGDYDSVCRAAHVRADHNGWYTDSFQDETLTGHVLQLPAHDGKPVFIPGTAHSDWDGVTIYPLDMYDDALDCAHAADQYAEHEAEEAREYAAKDQAQQRIGELRESIVTLRADCTPVCAGNEGRETC